MGPADYEMPGPKLEEMYKRSSLATDIIQVLDNDFRLAYGVISDFKNRLESIKPQKPLTTNSLNKVPNIVMEYYSNYLSNDILIYDLVDRFRLPETIEIIFNYRWLEKGEVSSVNQWLDNSLKALPILYIYTISKNKKPKLFEEHRMDEVNEMFNNVLYVASKKIRERDKIDLWFKKSFDKAYNNVKE